MVDSRFAAGEALLRGLAASPRLRDHDLAAFGPELRRAALAAGLGPLALAQPDGRMLLHTALPLEWLSNFLKERSKVLHMNGLPHDTTQSELESWFTQFGGRPIAFWTLRTPDQHKPTGSGFAVFSSHEEVRLSLHPLSDIPRPYCFLALSCRPLR